MFGAPEPRTGPMSVDEAGFREVGRSPRAAFIDGIAYDDIVMEITASRLMRSHRPQSPRPSTGWWLP